MVDLRHVDGLGRAMRVEDDIRQLGENTLGKLKEAIDRGDKEQALALADYLFFEGKPLHDTYTDWTYADLDYLARTYGEEEIPKMLRFARSVLDRPMFAKAGRITRLEVVKLYAEIMRGHRCGREELGDFKIWEEPDRYVMEFDPCGSGGRMSRGPQDGTGSRMEPPYNLGKTTKPYPWAWNKVDVPYYCVHCCVWNEVMAIEKNGYPFRVTEFTDPATPCYWYYYKDPNLIPAEYFERVGFKKDPAQFKM